MTDLSPEAEDLLRRARESFSPDQARIVAVRAALAARLGPSLPATGSAGGSVAKVGGISTAAKIVAVGALVVAVAAGARMMATPTRGQRTLASTSPAIRSPSGRARELASAEPALPHELPSVSVDDLPAARPDPAASGRAPLTARRSRDALEPRPPAVQPPEATATTAADTALGGEVSLLRAAHVALERGDAAGALALLDRYARTYPGGTLEEESLATRALTLCALGRAGEARGAARRLEGLAPRSPHLARVRASCAGDGDRPE